MRSRTASNWGRWWGVTPVPYDSGKSKREQGISKAGNRHVRCLMVELAWMWLR
ncbi:MAG: IS110 family transposase [Gemmataceae bacterium]|nr:IS110 family transposase [Gemmataceae bacterium]